MSQPHVSALLSKHSTIDSRIIEEARRPMPDARRLAELKKQKLRLKDELAVH